MNEDDLRAHMAQLLVTYGTDISWGARAIDLMSAESRMFGWMKQKEYIVWRRMGGGMGHFITPKGLEFIKGKDND